MASTLERSVKPRQPQVSVYDQELLTAKNAGTPVRFTLDVDINEITNEDCQILCKILFVDKFSIKVQIESGTKVSSQKFTMARILWLSKAQIASTEIIR